MKDTFRRCANDHIDQSILFKTKRLIAVPISLWTDDDGGRDDDDDVESSRTN